MKKCPFNHSLHEIRSINRADNCPHTNSPVPPTSTSTDLLTPVQAKKEYYYLLLEFLPSIMEILRRFKKDFPFGLVKYADGTIDSSYDDLSSGIDDTFTQKLGKATMESNFLRCSYVVHDEMARSIDIATEIWSESVDWDSGNLKRLRELVDPERRKLFGKRAAQKRISSAMIQTLHISASLEKFIYLFYCEEHNSKSPSPQEMLAFHRKTKKTALSLTEFHLIRTRALRSAFGNDPEDGIISRYTDPSYFCLIDGRLELKEGVISKAMSAIEVDTSDGRIGCPGKKYISELWKWIENVSRKYSYPVLS